MNPIVLLSFIVGLIILIIVHEFGHFLACRLFKVEVEEFGIGFPPRIVKLFERKGTAFTLNWIPLGGFVRPKGENDPSIPGGLAAANPWIRLGVMAAGPMMNLLVAVILAIFFFYQNGSPVLDKVIITLVEPNSPAAEAGLKPNDLFITAAGQTVDSTDKLSSIIEQNKGQLTEIVVQRGDQTITVSLVPRTDPPPNQGAMGIVMSNPTSPISLGQAVNKGVTLCYDNVRALLLLPVQLIQGQAQPKNVEVVGYVGMYNLYQQIGPPFFIFISLSLGLINLFPIPALDGGRILLTLPEILIRKRVPPQYETLIHLAGLAFLVLLMIYINGREIIGLIWPH